MFTAATNTSAHLKMGILGFQGAGKSKTAAKTTIGLVQHMKKLGIPYADKPVFFLDTETGSDWLLPDFAAAGIPIETAKTRAFSTWSRPSRSPKRTLRRCWSIRPRTTGKSCASPTAGARQDC